MNEVLINTYQTEKLNTQSCFCDKNYKWVRVNADLLSQTCVALFYKIVAAICWIFNSYYSHLFNEHANYILLKGNNHFEAYLDFGSEVVEFCVNSVLLKETHSEERRRFSKQCHQQINESGLPFFEKSLRRPEVGKDGCCVGISFDFVSCYLKEMRSNSTPLNAIKEIAPRYADGAPWKAEIAQKYYDATYPPEEETPAPPQQRSSLLKHCTKLKRQVKTKEKETPRQSRSKMLATIFGFKILEPHSFKKESHDYKSQINQLEEGVYIVNTHTSKKHYGHALVFIKTKEGPHFIQDSNIATLQIDPKDSTERLLQIIDDPDTLCFYKCSSL